jgi:hypothetical protein
MNEIDMIRNHYGDFTGLYDPAQAVAHVQVLLAEAERLSRRATRRRPSLPGYQAAIAAMRNAGFNISRRSDTNDPFDSAAWLAVTAALEVMADEASSEPSEGVPVTETPDQAVPIKDAQMRYRHKPHEVTAVQWRGDNRSEVMQFLKPIASKVSFDADLDEPSDHWNGVEFFTGDEQSTDDHWCDQGDWITVWQEGGHVVVMPDEHFRFDFAPAEATP